MKDFDISGDRANGGSISFYHQRSEGNITIFVFYNSANARAFLSSPNRGQYLTSQNIFTFDAEDSVPSRLIPPHDLVYLYPVSIACRGSAKQFTRDDALQATLQRILIFDCWARLPASNFVLPNIVTDDGGVLAVLNNVITTFGERYIKFFKDKLQNKTIKSDQEKLSLLIYNSGDPQRANLVYDTTAVWVP
ncbi:MAG: hypothetical protein HQK60_09600 [Deltaproteobacteria bacterium]|nr:hypothetical protein [Deltaproteobacteria bacterium]